MAQNNKTLRNPVLYVLKGNPIPLARMRISKYAYKGGGRRVYDAQKELKLVSSITLKSQHQGPLYQGPLYMDITFYFPIKKTQRNIHHDDYHFYRPDLDNCLKYVCDLCSHNLFDGDDAKVSAITCRKIYTNVNPRTEFTIVELKKNAKQ